MNARIFNALMLVGCGLVLGLSAQAADKIDLSLKNPAIEKLQARIAARAAKVSEWKGKGAIGEECTGLVKQMPLAGQGLAEKKEVRDLVVAENEDRYAMFRELILAHGLKETELTAVAEAFAKTKRQGAAANHMIQNPKNKEWVQKKDFSE